MMKIKCANCFSEMKIIAKEEDGCVILWCPNCGTIEQFEAGQSEGTRGKISIPNMTNSDGK